MPSAPGFELISRVERLCCKRLWFHRPPRRLKLETLIEPQSQYGLATSLPTDADKYGICLFDSTSSRILSPAEQRRSGRCG